MSDGSLRSYSSALVINKNNLRIEYVCKIVREDARRANSQALEVSWELYLDGRGTCWR